MKNSKIAFLFLAVFVGAVATAIPAMRGQSQKNSSFSVQERDDESYGPIADYAAPEPDDPIMRSKRKAKSDRYNGRHLKEDPRVTESGLIVEGASRLPALPAAFSDVVVRGEVVEAQAYMSSDKRGVYSEFTIHIHEVLKDNPSAPLAPGDTIVVEREGGRIRFQSGHVLRYSPSHKSMPRIGRQYVLFLQRNDHFLELKDQEQKLHIVTGYELREGRVFPLDGVNVPKDAAKWPQFAAYEGVEESAFLIEVLDAIKQSSQVSPAEAR